MVVPVHHSSFIIHNSQFILHPLNFCLVDVAAPTHRSIAVFRAHPATLWVAAFAALLLQTYLPLKVPLARLVDRRVGQHQIRSRAPGHALRRGRGAGPHPQLVHVGARAVAAHAPAFPTPGSCERGAAERRHRARRLSRARLLQAPGVKGWGSGFGAQFPQNSTVRRRP